MMIEDILSGCGIKYIRRTGAYYLKEIDKAINEGLSAKGVSAIILMVNASEKKRKRKRVFSPSIKKDVHSVMPVLHWL